MNDDALARRVAEIECPACKVESVKLEWRPEYSLGEDRRVATEEVPWVVCRRCGLESRGKR